MLSYSSLSALVREADEKRVPISKLVLSDQAELLEIPEEELFSRMRENLLVMHYSAENGAAQGIRSVSGLTGGDGYRLKTYAESGDSISGDFCALAIAKAVSIGEYNAAMGKIVAAPTAGSCGILPAAVLTMMEKKTLRETPAVMSLFTAGAIGLVIASEASISGAEGGCQAECGSAAAMAAGTLVELSGGSPEMVAHACAIALKNQLGLICDPVAGLVEVPCIKRNASGVMCAIMAADLALAGVKSVIPADEVISAMREVGEALPCSLRETAQGGLAATPTGLLLKKNIFSESF